MKKLKYISLILFLTFSISNVKAQIDTNYIDVFRNKVSLGLKLGALNNNFIITSNNLNYNLNSNIVPTVALWFKYKKLPAIAIAIPLTSFTADSLAKTIGISIGIKSQVAKGFIVDGYVFFERGFNFQNRADTKDIKAMPGTTNLSINLGLFYVFNFRRFSYKSAYLFGEIQKKSTGSFIVGLETGFFSLQNKNSLFHKDTDANKILNVQNISTLNVSLTGGYTHTFVFGRKMNWLVNASLLLGPNLNLGNTKYFSDRPTSQITQGGISTKYKFSVAHNFKKIALALTSKGDFATFKPSKEIVLNSNIIEFKLSGIYKF